MSPRRRPEPLPPAARAALTRIAVDAGQQLRDERLRREWTLRELATRAGTAVAVAHRVEAGDVATLESYARLATALGLRPGLEFVDPRTRRTTGAVAREASDLVHAAMGEVEVRILAHPGRTVSIDEPYQHYQFAGRADVIVWDEADLLHIENRTRFPNLQEAAGAWNAKRRYLARAIGDRAGVGPGGWRSVTHAMACLWSSEVLHSIRVRPASFAALCPDGPGAFLAWLSGQRPAPGITSTLVVLDPAVPPGSRRRTFAPVDEPPLLEPRYRGYADAAEAVRRVAASSKAR